RAVAAGKVDRAADDARAPAHEAQNRQRGHALAAAALADDTERFTGRDGEADAVHRADKRLVGARIEVRPEVLDLEQRRARHEALLGSRILFRLSPSRWKPGMVPGTAIAGAAEVQNFPGK